MVTRQLRRSHVSPLGHSTLAGLSHLGAVLIQVLFQCARQILPHVHHERWYMPD